MGRILRAFRVVVGYVLNEVPKDVKALRSSGFSSFSQPTRRTVEPTTDEPAGSFEKRSTF